MGSYKTEVRWNSYKIQRKAVCIYCHHEFKYLGSKNSLAKLYCSSSCVAKARYHAKVEYMKAHGGSDEGFVFTSSAKKLMAGNGGEASKVIPKNVIGSIDEFGNYIDESYGTEKVTVVETRGFGNFYSRGPKTRVISHQHDNEAHIHDEITNYSSSNQLTPAIY